ncbi:alpha/beta hydrolase [Bacillus sp. MUM 116]|uniref:alpha/beta fold hydrolase n=1 Tax=Bacillus sp. MUM 116 TaxID=1678002 RepID=UPI0008F5886A|nr:alpha/beta hydrolase [Bacillus sp. MUM 116]OIK11367.1 alpha/beta hydrolase [Bacillus sp. MUM 116]
MEAQSIELKNGTIAYIDKGNGTPIILLHGFCGSSRYWEEVIPSLTKNYRIIAPDLPGHGETSVFKDSESIELFADVIKEFLDNLKIDKITMFGHSLGGYIALAFAEKFSERLNGFSLIHSTAFPDSEEAKKGRDANADKVKQSGIRALIDGLVPKLFSPENVEKKAEYVEMAKQIGYTTPPDGAIGTLAAMKNRPDRNSVLDNTTLPVLLIAGEDDQIIPKEKTFSVSKPNIKQEVIKDSGHMSMYENPNVLIAEITKFLKEI